MKLKSITMIQNQNGKVWNGGTKAHCPLENFALPPQLARSWQQATSILLVDYLPRGHTITGQYYAKLIPKLRQAIQENRGGKLRCGVLFHQDNPAMLPYTKVVFQ
jgi:hypothetical protein